MQEATKMRLDETLAPLNKYKEQLQTIYASMKVEHKLKRLEEIAHLESLDGFWEDTQKASQIQQEKSLLTNVVESYLSLKENIEDYEVLQNLAKDENDESTAVEALEIFDALEAKVESTLQKALLSGETDGNNAIVSINAGAGGTESCDWANILYRMITRWCESKAFKLKTLDIQPGDTAGIKSTTFMVEGPFAYGLLKSETGIHRLVRISPFDSNARRHTSFASVFVSPELDDSIEIDIQDKDLKIDVYRSGGAGGQSVNTTDSAVRITHLPSGTVVTCQNERSQLQNKLFAMKILKSRLYEKAMEEKRAEQAELESSKKEIGWGSQIRSYVLHPYKMVKDHRTNNEVSSPDKVLDGDIDSFINSFLKWSTQSNQ